MEEWDIYILMMLLCPTSLFMSAKMSVDATSALQLLLTIIELASIISIRYTGLIPKRFKKLEDRPSYDVNTSKLKGLGFNSFRSIPKMFDDCIASLVDQGHLFLSPPLCTASESDH